MATTKGIIIMTLVFCGMIALIQSLLSLLWNAYPDREHESANGLAMVAMSIGFFTTSIFVWKKWEEEGV